MRAYQLCPGGPWIDLDSVQMIYPPTMEGEWKVALHWRLAFQDNNCFYWWDQPRDMVENAGETIRFATVMDASGIRPSKFAYVEDVIYHQFLNAWKNK